ncbi:MAG: hypothetical protein WC916_06575 [Candidatus Woesearchaeota archaeon]
MNKTIKNIALWIAGISAITSMNIHAQNVNAEVIKSLKPGSSYERLNAEYQLPAGIKGFTFAEFYSDGNSYFSKTALTKQVVENVGVMGQMVNGSGFDDHAGLGVSIVVPTPDKTFAKVYVVPKYFTSNGTPVDNKCVAGYYAEAELPLDMKISSFGEVNLNGTNGVEWMYGEVNLEKKLTDNISISYNPALQNKAEGSITPILEHRFTFKYVFQ